MKRAKLFFDEYASDFDSIYGQNRTLPQKMIDTFFRKSMRLRFEKSLEFCQPLDGRTILDIGCGPGHYCIALAEQGAKKVVGIDFSKDMIEIAKKRAASMGLLERCEFFVQDFFEFSSSDRFDYIVIMGVMDYIEDPESFIKKVGALSPQKVCFSFPADGGILSLQRKIRYRKRCPLYMYTFKEIERLLCKLFDGRYDIEKIERDFFVSLNFEGSIQIS